MSRLQSRRHIYYYLKKYFKLVGIAIVVVTQTSTSSIAEVQVPINNTATYTYRSGSLLNYGSSNRLRISSQRDSGILDPAGQITGCGGELLPNYEGFTVSLYDTPDSLRIGNLVKLTTTEVPDIPGNGIPLGLAPNQQNTNPYAMTIGDAEGKYNFLLDPNKGQLAPGSKYILVIKPPANSIYSERQILIHIVQVVGQNVTITASSLNGQILDVNAVIPSSSVTITAPLDSLGTNLSLVGLAAGVCNPQTLQIVKSADRASAQPGDTVIYRLLLKNISTSTIQKISVTDTLPLGFRLQTNLVKAKQDNTEIPVDVKLNGNVATFTFPDATNPLGRPLASNRTINLAYATTLTPDAARGTGKNSALFSGLREIDTGTIPVSDGPAIHQLQISQGILADTGTIIGRVFVDKNFDGEQQPNEPGIPNAVVFLDDGNKITTDANGMFSVKSAANGYRTGVLDLSSLPGYTLAPNLYFKERNSQSRLVKLAPSGLVRMNFGVTPTAKEAK